MAQAAAAEFRLPTKSKIIILTAVLASLLEIIDTSIVNVAIPTMMGNLGATLEDISWVVTGYIIANAIVLPIAGWMGMQIGRKKYYTGCILLFTATSVACGLAPNLPTLVVFRIIQGFMGGALLPTSQALLQEQFPREKSGLASAIYGMSVMIGPTLGPTMGGYLTDNFGWRMIFNINLPLGLVAAMMAYLYIEDWDPDAPGGERRPLGPDGKPLPRPRTPIDWIGLALLASGIGSLQFVLERGQADDWFSSGAIIFFSILAAFSLPGFIWWELREKHPIMDLRLYKHAILRNGTMVMATVGMMLYSLIFVIPIFVSTMFGYTATQTGMLFIPGALLTAMVMPFVGAQLRRHDPRILIVTGVVILEIAILMFSQLNAQTSQMGMFWPLLVRGAGMAFLFVPINAVVLGQFRGLELGQVAGMMNLSRQIGGSVGIAALSTLLQRYNAQNYGNLLPHVSLLSLPTQQTLRAAQGIMTSRLASEKGLATASALAVKSISFRVAKQVFALSTQQLFWTLFFAFAVALIPVSRLKGAKPVQGPVDAH